MRLMHKHITNYQFFISYFSQAIQGWKKSGNGKLNCVETVLKIRGAYGVDEELAEESDERDNVIFVDDDRWQFCQSVGMHLGYFWCLTELNELTDECTQNCEGVGVKMNDVRSTSSSTKKKEHESSLKTMIDSFEKQSKRMETQTEKHVELNLVRDSLSELNNSLIFLKAEKYEALKLTIST